MIIVFSLDQNHEEKEEIPSSHYNLRISQRCPEYPAGQEQTIEAPLGIQ